MMWGGLAIHKRTEVPNPRASPRTNAIVPMAQDTRGNRETHESPKLRAFTSLPSNTVHNIELNEGPPQAPKNLGY